MEEPSSAKLISSYCIQEIFEFLEPPQYLALQSLNRVFYRERIPRFMASFFPFKIRYYQGVILNKPIDLSEIQDLKRQRTEAIKARDKYLVDTLDLTIGFAVEAILVGIVNIRTHLVFTRI